MSFFSNYFNLSDISGEVAVVCPFPHRNTDDSSYYETNPSAHINLDKNVFHCKSCGTGHNEVTFIQEMLQCDVPTAIKLSRCFSTTETLTEWEQEISLTKECLAYAKTLGISEEVSKQLHVTAADDGGIRFPVFLHNHLVDIRTYRPHGEPKLKSRVGSPGGMIIPYDLWRESNKITILCAGEKDMAVARSNGFNAITGTGGELTVPKILAEFKDRIVAICYDNDAAGKAGAIKVAQALYGIAKEVKVVLDFHTVCKEPGEDITDFFVKYKQTKADLIRHIQATKPYEPSSVDNDIGYPIIDLFTASNAKYINKLVRSNIQVVATNESSFVVPSTIMATKEGLSGQNDSMGLGETKEWNLQDDNIQDILHLLDNNFKETVIRENMKNLLRVSPKEKRVSIKKFANKTVHKAYVTDMFESSARDTIAMEYTAYSIGVKLESGKKYLATYKIVPHPYKGQQLTMIIVNAVAASDSVSKFKVNEEVRQSLDLFKNLEGTVAERITACVESVKGILGYDGNNTLIEAIDLSYHTVLNFDFGTFKNVRGYLDTFIVGESRVGKSSTADALRSMYSLGVFTSLAGNAATIPGLVGGSNKVSGSYQTRAGLIPQNHRGLIIFEELGKSNTNITKELTDIRSSNEVRITRVAGTLTLPATVRMITLTNVKSTDGVVKPIASYPNGISVIVELIGTAEDIARYDLLLVLSDRGNNQINPLWKPREPFPTKAYQDRVRWVWSREAEDLDISDEVANYVIKTANELNEIYDSHIKIFGTEAWKKLLRLSIAIAGYLVSTDETYEKIIITKEHIDYAREFMVRIYDNKTFKLKEFVNYEKQFSTIDDEGVKLLQDLYTKNPILLLQLEQSSKTSKNMLSAATGLTNDELNRMLTTLTRGLFVRFYAHDIVPTERFRLGMSQINRSTSVKRLGEHYG